MTRRFKQVAAWASSGSYDPPAVAKFLSDAADSYLVAHALAEGHIVVTEEIPAKTRTKIKIPDACRELGVDVMSTFSMLRKEGVRFVLPARSRK